MNFFKTFFASCLGALVALASLFFISILIFSSLASSLSEGKEIAIDYHSVLKLSLNALVEEQEKPNPFEDMPGFGEFSEGSIGVLSLLHCIDAASKDSKIEGIYVDVSNFKGGFSKAREIRNALAAFKKSGKWVIAYAENYSERSYYVASVCDQVYLNPQGDIEFNGFSIEPMFFKGLLSKLEIQPEVFRVGDFKSAVEPFILDKMSAENKLQLTELLTDLYTTEIADVAATRKIDVAKLKSIADHATITNANDAVTNHLIDSLIYYDEFLSIMRKKLSLDSTESIPYVSYHKYKKSISTFNKSKNEIAIIVADGDIQTGKSEDGVGSDEFAKLIRQARTNKNVKAIVLRINSPGGSALASDIMWREVVLASKEKPVVASMSDLAASGGYYLAMGCGSIVANPITITGSIGVFSVLFDMSKFWNNKLGITFDEVKTGDVGNMVNFNRPLTELEKSIWQKRTNEIYETFTSKAAQGRKMSIEEIKKIGGGRVWSGTRAVQLGLADTLGGFNDAVQVAAHKAGLAQDYKMKFYPKQKSFIEELFNKVESESKALFQSNIPLQEHELLNQIKRIKALQGTQTRLPFEIRVD